jgi:aconitate hydratase 2/2-methylisocitrate dehydratase
MPGVLVRFSGELQPGITLRDLVQGHSITAIQMGLLTVDVGARKTHKTPTTFS